MIKKQLRAFPPHVFCMAIYIVERTANGIYAIPLS